MRASNGEQAFDAALREFLDHFYANPADREASLCAQPIPLDDLRDAYPGPPRNILPGATICQSRRGSKSTGLRSDSHFSPAVSNR